MKSWSFWFALVSVAFVLAAGFFAACGDDDDDDDDDPADDGADDDASTDGDGDGLCYVQCEEGCITTGACLSGITDDAECATWGAGQCAKDDCAMTQSLFVPDCSICSECADQPDWY